MGIKDSARIKSAKSKGCYLSLDTHKVLSEPVINGRRITQKGNMPKFGLYPSDGEQILPFEYEHIGDTLDYIAVCKNGEWFYINKHSERVLL